MKVNTILVIGILALVTGIMLSQDSNKKDNISNVIELTSDEAKELLLLQRDIMNIERQISSLIENRLKLVDRYKISISKVENKYGGTFNENTLTVTKTKVENSNKKDNKVK